MSDRLSVLLNQIKHACQQTLGDALAGVYVHGSIAFGCFTWETGDVDFLIVVHRSITHDEKVSLMKALLDLEASAPPKGLEMSVVLLSACRQITHPAPYELHYSSAYRESCRADVAAHCERLHGCDVDLAAHFTVVRAAGYALCGLPVEAVFAPVPREAYVDSIMRDIESAREDIIANPVYVALNLCRVLAYLHDGLVLSKKQGGAWGIKHLPEAYHVLIQAALDAYEHRRASSDLSDFQLTGFADDMLARISMAFNPSRSEMMS